MKMTKRALNVMRRRDWMSAMAIGDLLSLPSADTTSERNTLSAGLIRLCNAGKVERRIVERFGSCGSRYEFRVVDPSRPSS